MLTGEVEQKVTADMMIEFIGQDGAKTCEELAGKFGVSTRKVASTLAVVTATGRLARVNQNGKFRYCMPGDNLPAEPKAALVTESDGKAFPQPAGAALPVREAATQEEIKTETVADIVQPLPSFTETQADELIFPSLRRANRRCAGRKVMFRSGSESAPRCGAEQVPGYSPGYYRHQRTAAVSGWKTWCRAEIMILRQCAGTMKVKSVGALIGRTEAAVRTKARELGISMMLRGDFHPSAKYSQRDIELARQLHQRGMQRREIARKLGMPLRIVNNYVYFDRRVSA